MNLNKSDGNGDHEDDFRIQKGKRIHIANMSFLNVWPQSFETVAKDHTKCKSQQQTSFPAFLLRHELFTFLPNTIQ